MTQVFSCCHLGGSMDFDSKGNLYFATGDNTGNAPNNTNGGYVNSDPTHTIPCPGTAHQRLRRHRLRHHPAVRGQDRQAVRRAAATSATAMPARRRATPTPTKASCCASSRSRTRVTRRASEPTYTIPGADAPNGPQLFPPDSQAVLDGKAKPEVFAMGTRNLYSIDIDPKTDKIATAWVGPDQGTDSTTYGTSKTENAALMGAAGNYGWPYCQGGNRLDYRAKLPNPVGQGNGGAAANLSDNIRGTVGGGADGQTGAYWDCSKSAAERLAVQHGPDGHPGAEADEHLVRPERAAARTTRATPTAWRSSAPTATPPPAPATYRQCPFVFGGSQAPMTAGIYRKPAGNAPNAWPAYWDGRWFLSDFAGAQQHPPRAADGPGHRHQGRPAGLGRLALRHHADEPVRLRTGPSTWTSVPTATCTSRATPARTSRSATPTPACGSSPTSAATTRRARIPQATTTTSSARELRHRQVRRRLLRVDVRRRRHRRPAPRSATRS